ncbi:MAG TPA: response regulator transcription factor [Blastocatellia bacterium]|nr:response regulator transcription factor [Blastocatellia bacterium]
MKAETRPAEIRIVIADDHPVFRKGLRQIIETDPRLKVVGEAEDGEAALERLRETRPEVVILDVGMPDKDGLEVARAIRAQRLQVEIIFLTMYRDEHLFNAALDLGVKGYLLKDSAVTEVIAGIKAVSGGQNYISPPLSTYLINRGRRSATLVEQQPGLEDLTPAERRVLKLIAEYKTSKEIADELCLSARTVEHHRANICEKLDLKGSHALLKFAAQHQSQL